MSFVAHSANLFAKCSIRHSVNFFRKIKKHRSHRWTLVAPWYVTVSHRCSRPLHATVGPHPLTPPHAPRWHHHIHHERERGVPGSVATSATTTTRERGGGYLDPQASPFPWIRAPVLHLTNLLVPLSPPSSSPRIRCHRISPSRGWSQISRCRIPWTTTPQPPHLTPPPLLAHEVRGKPKGEMKGCEGASGLGGIGSCA